MLKGKKTIIFNAIVLPAMLALIQLPGLEAFVGDFGMELFGIIATGGNTYLRLITDTAVGNPLNLLEIGKKK